MRAKGKANAVTEGMGRNEMMALPFNYKTDLIKEKKNEEEVLPQTSQCIETEINKYARYLEVWALQLGSPISAPSSIM